MSYYNKGPLSDWRLRSNGLHKSSSQPKYYLSPELNKYSDVYLPLIRHHQQAENFANQINKRNKIKDEILYSKYKFLKNRGLNNNNNISRNIFKDSWKDFFKRKEREKMRKKLYKIIKDENYSSSEESENANEIFRNGMNRLPSKIEDKIKLKQYLPAKKDLYKLMRKVNDNISEKVDLNNYVLSKNIHNLEYGYDNLRDLLVNKINKIERKQEEDFDDLRRYFIRRAKREKHKYDNNSFMKNGENYINRNNINPENYYNSKMNENIEKLQSYEIAKKIKNIPNLLDNMIYNLEGIRQYRKEQKNDFLMNFRGNINKNLDYYDPLYDDIDNELNNNFNIYDYYDKYNYDNIFNNNNYNNYNDYKLSRNELFTPNYSDIFYKKEPKTEIKKNIRKNLLTKSRLSIDSLKKNLKPLSHQLTKNKKDDDDGNITGRDLMKIYEQRDINKKMNNRYNNMVENNKSNNKDLNNLKENIYVNNNEKKEKEKKEEKKEEDDGIVVIDSSEDKKSGKSKKGKITENNNISANNKKEEVKQNEANNEPKEEQQKDENNADKNGEKEESEKPDNESNNFGDENSEKKDENGEDDDNDNGEDDDNENDNNEEK